MNTVLIIKLGYCETLVNEEGFVPSLGDVFRHTVLLHHYSQYHVTWLTSETCVPLLKDNPLIHELLIFNGSTAAQLRLQAFDEVLCLEKTPTLCELARSISAGRHLGFRRNSDGTSAHPGAQSALDIANGKDYFVPIQSLLFQMVGDYWQGENYVLGYNPQPRRQFDVGLNFRVGSKWPSKSWPQWNWNELQSLCENHGLTVSRQEGQADLCEYMDWINACNLIVTCDSLGMHLGLALKKKVVALFGPTPSRQIHMYGRGVILSADWACAQTPCMKAQCSTAGACMTQIRPSVVARTINNLLNGNTFRSQSTECERLEIAS